jgi:hypothetical protein
MVGRRDLLKRGGGAIAAVGLGTGLNGAALASDSDGPGKGDPKHIALIVLDRSGSMSRLQASVTKSVNDFLDEQADKANFYIGLVQFDSMKNKDGGFCEPIFGFTLAKDTPRLGPNDYQPRGNTPLLAAVAESISKLEQVIRPMDRALMTFQTDGLENASPPEITKAVIKQLISAKEAEGNWTFAFMGADIDAWGEGGSLGYHAGSTLQYANTSAGTGVAYATLSRSTNNWYFSTGGGTGAVAMASAPTNTADNFFVTDSTIVADIINASGIPRPVNYTSKTPWTKLSTETKQRWLKAHKEPTA